MVMVLVMVLVGISISKYILTYLLTYLYVKIQNGYRVPRNPRAGGRHPAVLIRGKIDISVEILAE